DGRDDRGHDAAGAHGPDDAEEAGVAGGQHDHRAWAAGEGAEGFVEVPELFALRGFRDGRGVEVAGGADDGSGLGQGLGGVRGRGAAVAADHGDVHAAASAIFCCPVKSTMMTRTCGGVLVAAVPAAVPAAVSAANRLRTRAARAHSSRPAAGSRPASSQSSAACRAVLALATLSARSFVPPAATVMSLSRPRSTLERV